MSLSPAPEGPNQQLVRGRIQGLLADSPAFHALPPERQETLSNDMVKVAQYMVLGPSGDNIPQAATLVGAPAARTAESTSPAVPDQRRGSPAVRSLADRPYDPAGQTAGERFGQGGGAIAAQQGSAALSGLIQSVNFPGFVAGLIDGVFNAIVTASIKQMDAYQKLVANVAKSVDEYMKDNITENSARDYLASRYPDHIQVDTSGDKPVVKPREGADDATLPDFGKDLGLKEPVSSLDEDTTEQVLLPAARRRMAMDRQQLLATMVLMGINRLVVTDGSIEASCTFSLDTRDRVARHYDRATQFDYESDYSESGGGWFSPDTSLNETAKFSVSTHQSEDSESKVDLHAKLGGKVNVHFKSETFPLDKMADIIQPKQPAPAAPRAAAPAQPVAPVAGR